MAAPSNADRIIVGLDYGTTGTAVAFSKPNRRGYKVPRIYKAWTSRGGCCKVPSVIAYEEENNFPRAWGFKVPADSVDCAWTKLLLDGDSPLTEHDDDAISDAWSHDIRTESGGGYRPGAL
ncbi:uncharacterized protein BJX67DRAFT_367238 [Aspergillus lucknowensis]|uniref:Actin-like ATPase domain-containing protein n=1 Tax=Aspergillus lucknowensis TaxID=176173 RepID=A0ABR4L992_9EURO